MEDLVTKFEILKDDIINKIKSIQRPKSYRFRGNDDHTETYFWVHVPGLYVDEVTLVKTGVKQFTQCMYVERGTRKDHVIWFTPDETLSNMLNECNRIYGEMVTKIKGSLCIPKWMGLTAAVNYPDLDLVIGHDKLFGSMEIKLDLSNDIESVQESINAISDLFESSALKEVKCDY